MSIALRDSIRQAFEMPSCGGDLHAHHHGTIERNGLAIEKWVYTAEPGSKVPALLWRPIDPPGPMPAVVMTCGHGGSKGQPHCQYVAQSLARLGVAVLATDPVGEEERHVTRGMGTRQHDDATCDARAMAAERLMMGKMLFDYQRGLDWLMTRDDIDPARIGVSGNSLGGCKAGWLAAIDPRLRMAIVSGWAFSDILCHRSKSCTRQPNQRFRELADWHDLLRLTVPHCPALIINGDADVIIDHEGSSEVWRDTDRHAARAGETVSVRYIPGGGHRPYGATVEALLFVHDHLGTPGWTRDRIANLPTLKVGQWADAYGIVFDRLYNNDLHYRGLVAADLDVTPLPLDDLAVLSDEETGDPQYTLDGWLARIER